MEASAVIPVWDPHRIATIPLDSVTDRAVWLHLNPRFRRTVRLFARVNISAGGEADLNPVAFELAPEP